MEMENPLTEDATAVTGLSDQEGSITGEGKHYSTYFRMYEADFGRWWGVDPVTHPFQSPYTAFDNNPVNIIDPMGADGEGFDSPLGPADRSGNGSGTFNDPVRMDEVFITAPRYDPNDLVLGLDAFRNSDQQSWDQTVQFWSNTQNQLDAASFDNIYKNPLTYDESSLSLNGTTFRSDMTSNNSSTLAALSLGIDGIGGLGGGMSKVGGSFRFTNGSYGGNRFSPYWYASGWGGGSTARITTYSNSVWGARLSNVGYIGTLSIGAYNAYEGYYEDGNEFGYNFERSLAGTAGGLVGSTAMGTLGASIGVWFGGVGAIPGWAIGSFFGSMFGGYVGSEYGTYLYDTNVEKPKE